MHSNDFRLYIQLLLRIIFPWLFFLAGKISVASYAERIGVSSYVAQTIAPAKFFLFFNVRSDFSFLLALNLSLPALNLSQVLFVF